MCSAFRIGMPPDAVLELGRLVGGGEFSWPDVIRPTNSSPVVIENAGEREVHLMRFGLVPSWSETKRSKYATHNARADSLNKPTWRGPLARSRCVVPLTEFLEPIHRGENQGYWVHFRRADDAPLFAAGLYDVWRDPGGSDAGGSDEGGDAPLESFAIVTGAALDLVERVGHDRSPVFLSPEGVEAWLAGYAESKATAKILESPDLRANPSLEFERGNAMKGKNAPRR